MRTIARLAHPGNADGRLPLRQMLDQIRRVLDAAVSDGRPSRPLRDIDDWSDQAEVAFYEGGGAGRAL